jgi:putative chitinase
MGIDRAFLLERINQTLFNRAISRTQAFGVRLIVDVWEASAGAAADRRQLAYVLATAFHETGATMRPIREQGGKAYLTTNYDVLGDKPNRARRNGNTEAGDGVRYAGRGFVQLTWKNNYRKVGVLLGLDLVAEPDKALDPETAAIILIRGMREGWFTGRKLAEFFDTTRAEWVQARRIVNGVDKAPLIAGHARKFEAALQEAVAVKASTPSRPQPQAASPRRLSR